MKNVVASSDYTVYLGFDDTMTGTANIKIYPKEGISVPRVVSDDKCVQVTFDASVLRNFYNNVARTRYRSLMGGTYEYASVYIRECRQVLITDFWRDAKEFLEDVTLKGYSVRYFGYVEVFKSALKGKKIYNTDLHGSNPAWADGLEIQRVKMTPDSIDKDMLVVIDDGLYMITM